MFDITSRLNVTRTLGSTMMLGTMLFLSLPAATYAAPSPTLSLTANPVEVGKGGAATLLWISKNTKLCTASGGWSGSKGRSGSQTVKNITSSRTYKLTCAGTTKKVSASVNVAMAPPPPPPPPPAPVVVGLNVQPHTTPFDATNKAFTLELGAHSIRIAFNHGDFNGAVNWASQNGVGVLFMLGYGAGCAVDSSTGKQCYADRSADLVRKYGNKVQYWEVWNEWNGHWGANGSDPVKYTELLCKTYQAIKAVNPNAKVVGGVTAGVDTNFIGKILDAGAGNCMDMVSVHPYVFGAKGVGYNAPATVAADKFIERMTAVHNLVFAKTGNRMQVLASEDGRKDKEIAAEQQRTADYITEVFGRARTVPFIEGIWWYELKDNRSQPGWLGSGLVRRDNTKKPAFAAFQDAANK